MSDRHSGYVVVLDFNVRDEVSQDIIKAIYMIKGVINVTPVVATPEQTIAEQRVKRSMLDAILDLFEPGRSRL